MLGSLASWLASGLQTSAGNDHHGGAHAAGVASKGRVQLRLRMSRENAAAWRELEARALRWLPRGMSWLRFLCLSFWHAWQHVLGAPMAYGHIYVRDRFRCMNPVCPRRDVTPHHLVFRSAGGSDEDVSMGFSYIFGVGSSSRVVVDYAFSIPTGVDEAGGSHRMAVGMRF